MKLISVFFSKFTTKMINEQQRVNIHLKTKQIVFYYYSVKNIRSKFSLRNLLNAKIALGTIVEG